MLLTSHTLKYIILEIHKKKCFFLYAVTQINKYMYIFYFIYNWLLMVGRNVLGLNNFFSTPLIVSNIFSPYSGGSFIQFCNPGNLLFLENLLLNDLGSVGKSRKISALNEEKEEEEEWEEEE